MIHVMTLAPFSTRYALDPFQQELGEAQLIIDRGDSLPAAGDPRSETWGTAGL
jgi:hypothetical protein